MVFFKCGSNIAISKIKKMLKDIGQFLTVLFNLGYNYRYMLFSTYSVCVCGGVAFGVLRFIPRYLDISELSFV